MVPHSTIGHFFTKLFVDQSVCVATTTTLWMWQDSGKTQRAGGGLLAICNFNVGPYGALFKCPLHKGLHQNQAIAQKLSILGEKVTSMTGLKIQKYLLGTI